MTAPIEGRHLPEDHDRAKITHDFFSTYPGFHASQEIRQIVADRTTGVVRVMVPETTGSIPESGSFSFGGHQDYDVVAEIGDPPGQEHLKHVGPNVRPTSITLLENSDK